MPKLGSFPAGAEVARSLSHPVKRRLMSAVQATSSASGFGNEDSSESVSGGGEEHDDSDSDTVSDVDTPRVAQWEDDNDPYEDDAISASSHSDRSSEVDEPLKQSGNELRNNLSTMPFGTLLKARNALEQAQVESESDDNSEAEEEEEGHSDIGHPSTSKLKDEEQRWPGRSSKLIEKRSNKHAPLEAPSTRPVTRRRTIIDVKKVNYRDPRFSPLTGELSTKTFKSHYSFLSDLHSSELSTLRENLKRAKKLLRSSPRELQEQRQKEVQRLEQAVKRAESSVNRDRRERVEETALDKVREEEKAKRKDGKGGWWMKEAAKRDLLLRARHDALAESGGKRAVKKAIEKRQKKVSQKEKRSRPAAVSGASSRSERTSDNGWGKRALPQSTTDGQSVRQGKRRRIV